MPLIDIPCGFVEVEEAATGLEREKQELQSLLHGALKAQGDPKAPKRTRAEANGPAIYARVEESC